MPQPELERARLQKAMTLFARVQLSLADFEREVGAFMSEQLGAMKLVVDRKRLDFDEAKIQSGSELTGYAHWKYATAPLTRFADLGTPDTWLTVGVAWPRQPSSEREFLPFAYINIRYGEGKKPLAWKAHFKAAAEKWDERILYSSITSKYAELMFRSDEYHRDDVDALAKDLRELLTYVEKAARA